MNTFSLKESILFGLKKRVWFFERCLKKYLVFSKEKQAVPTTTKLTSDKILISYFKYLALFFQQLFQKKINLTKTMKCEVYSYCTDRHRDVIARTQSTFFS